MSQEEKTRPAEWAPEQDWGPIERGENLDFSAVYQRQQSRCPVAWRKLEGGGFWAVFRHADVVEVLSDPKRFSSAVLKFGAAPMIPIEVDPPEHTQYRRLLAQLINPARVQRYEPQIRGHVREMLREALKATEPDLLQVTRALPLRAFCLLVGEPDPATWRAISEQREARNEARLALLDAASIERRKAAAQPIFDYIRGQIAERRAQPADDLVSDILSQEIDGRPVTDDEALRTLALVYIAGHRTTTAALGGTIIQLARRPELHRRLRASAEEIPLAIEEILRLETPVHALPRYCTEDTELGGQLIRKGDQVFPLYGAANVDPEVFEAPSSFVSDRRPLRHVAFGRGVHVCAGAPFARLQLRVFLEELLALTSSLELTGPVTRLPWPHFGPTSLPVRVRLAD